MEDLLTIPVPKENYTSTLSNQGPRSPLLGLELVTKSIQTQLCGQSSVCDIAKYYSYSYSISVTSVCVCGGGILQVSQKHAKWLPADQNMTKFTLLKVTLNITKAIF